MSEDKAKVQNPKAYEADSLPTLPAGLAWDEVEIGKIDFAIIVPVDFAGMSAQCKGNVGKAAQFYARALRIDVPAKLKARDRIESARKAGTLAEVIPSLQEEIAAFDVTTLPTRAPRTSKPIVAEEKETYSKAEFEAMVAAAGHKVVYSK